MNDDEIADRIASAAFRLASRWFWPLLGLFLAFKFGLFVLIFSAFFLAGLWNWLATFEHLWFLTIVTAFLSFFVLLVAANIWHLIKWWKS